MPFASQIGGVNNALAIGRPIGPRPPCGFFVTDLSARVLALRRHIRLHARERPTRDSLLWRWYRLRTHAPEATCAVDVAAIADVNDLFVVTRPGGADLMIELAVVIARQRAAILAGQPLK